jgi:hypothetical protein
MAAWPACSLPENPRVASHREGELRQGGTLISVITAFGEQVTVLQGQVEPHYGQHPDAEMSLSRPGPGPVPGAGVLSGSGADPHRYAFAGARRNRAAACPITR